MKNSKETEDLQRIEAALDATRAVFARFTPGAIAAEYKAGHDPVTEADRLVDAVLRQELLKPGEGWLSEESDDDLSRLETQRVWIVDPLDGTREFVAGIPEFCVSAAMVENGKPITGGICNPVTGEIFLGSISLGVFYNGKRVVPRHSPSLAGAVILASRSEVKRGEWKDFENLGFEIRPMGSVAYKLARVAAGLADATFTLSPKHEWDVAGGAALVLSGGGFVTLPDDAPLVCNKKNPLLPGLIAGSWDLRKHLLALVTANLRPSAHASQ
jgi:myo-inositol-1(or 4)-monophosphatase